MEDEKKLTLNMAAPLRKKTTFLATDVTSLVKTSTLRKVLKTVDFTKIIYFKRKYFNANLM